MRLVLRLQRSLDQGIVKAAIRSTLLGTPPFTESKQALKCLEWIRL